MTKIVRLFKDITAHLYEYMIQMDYSMTISLVFDGAVTVNYQILLTYSMVSKWYDVGFIVDVVLFDFAKAFIVVSHNILVDS